MMYIFAEPYDEDVIETIQNGEYIKAKQLAEMQASKARISKKAANEEIFVEEELAEKPSADEELAAEEFAEGTFGAEATAEAVSANGAFTGKMAPEELFVDASLPEETAVEEISGDELSGKEEVAAETLSTDEAPAEEITGEESFVEEPKAEEMIAANMSSEEEDASTEQLAGEETFVEMEDTTTDIEAKTVEENKCVNRNKLHDRDRPLLGMILQTQHFINHQPWHERPNPSSVDRWEVGYRFEILDPNRASSLHKMCLERQRKAFYEVRKPAEDGGKPNKWKLSYLKFMRQLSSAGKKWRCNLEKERGNRENIVWREGPPPSRYGTMKWKCENDTDANDTKES
jgi:hypothetical protein